MEAYYSNCNSSDPLAVASRELRRADYYFWKSIWQAYPPQEDIDAFAAATRLSTGYGPGFIEGRITTFEVLKKLPQLQTLVEELFHLDMYILSAIANHTYKIDPALVDNPDTWALIDEGLTSYLTPTKPCQELPNKKSIIQKLSRLLNRMQARKPHQAPRPAGSYGMSEGAEDGTRELYATFTTAQGEVLDKAVRSHAESTGLSRAEALHALVMDKVSVKVTLNLYQASDVENAPVMLADGRILENQDMIWLDDLPTTIIKAENLIAKGTLSYQASESLKAFIAGRDGSCRFPGCDTPAELCDKDHVVNFADGGPTHHTNLASLSRRHHNMKTDGTIKYVLNPINGDIAWLFPNGTWVISQPSGPVSPKMKRWVRTLDARNQARYERLWCHSADPQINTDPAQDDPPF